MNNLKFIISMFLLIGISGCDSSKSLQEYIVDKQQDNSFISIDIPSSILTLKDENISDETLKAIKSINPLTEAIKVYGIYKNGNKVS